MFSKRFLLGFVLAGLMLAVPLLMPDPGFGQEPEYYKFILKWGGTGTGDGQFCFGTEHAGRPVGIAVDSEDNVYVVDRENQRIQKFDKDGNFLGKWGTPGTGDGELFYPGGIAIDKNDNVYVTDGGWEMAGISRVQKFDYQGNFLCSYGIPYYHYSEYSMRDPAGVDIDRNGLIFLIAGFPDVSPGVIKKFDSNFEYIGSFGSGISHDDTDPYNFWYPSDIAINSKGEIFISVWGEYYCGGLEYPHDPDLNGHFIHYHSQIKKFDSNFQFIKRWYLNSVAGIAIDSEDNVLVCSVRDAEMGVYKYDSEGNLLQRVAPNGSEGGEIWGPYSIAIDSKGNVYIGDLRSDSVLKFAPPFVPYTFDGFFNPIENAPVVNQAKAGQAIPVKWRITDKNGLPISDPASFVSLTSYSVNCATFEGDPTILVEEVAAGSSGLQYLEDGWWQYTWKTPKSYAGQCRIMRLTLDDKSEHTASFKFK